MTALLPLLQLLRLASPGLPIGGFSYSQGLESALELGLVHDAASARQWLGDALQGPVCQFDAALLVQAIRMVAAADAQGLARLNQRYLASRDCREQQQETLQMGYSLRQLLAGLPEGQAMGWPVSLLDEDICLPVAWAMAAQVLGIAEREALTALLWSWLENQVMVLLKAMPMGQSAGQQLLSALLPLLASAVERAISLPAEQHSNFAPGLMWAAMRHETQYSRLFRS
ncbi:urease accessory protein UreF [Aquitalea magnusonii]|uniref:Urease accessory protein UreF n=1 Tax=Aquitalea magnusonii TaxID=332411 RepID=A0A3G9GFH3_9NEIS|nr:urease accessory UreF family protein [Aquitalea magnusonii]BBF85001.1 urease accessory protein UreF [Aquitalea magnusonii]